MTEETTISQDDTTVETPKKESRIGIILPAALVGTIIFIVILFVGINSI